MRLVDVILPLAIRDCYTYSVPDDLPLPAAGTRVLVPLMKKEVRGVVLRSYTQPVEDAFVQKIRPVIAMLDSAPMISPEQLALWKWMSGYYMCALGEVMAAALPGGLDKRLTNPPKRRRVLSIPYDGPIESMHDLSSAQSKSVESIGTFWNNGKDIVLLHGVTSSGKTDIYIHLIEAQLKAGKNVLYLVPEIALTTQLTSRLQLIFGDRLIVYHSRFTDAEREKRYNQISNYKSQTSTNFVVLGTRSAIFLPVSNLGLVIVDEEHDPSYKQVEPNPRYHARAAAIVLAKEHGAKVLLGTATPSIESYYLAQKGIYGLVSLTERFGGAELPDIKLIDLSRQYDRKEMYGHFSDPLVDRIRQCLADKKQVILFQNRRGYAPQIQCMACGQPPRCVQCDVPMTLHKRDNELRCHYCGYHAPVPAVCPQCGGELKAFGIGTERIEDEIQKLFPEARVLRMDLDTTRSRQSYEQLLHDFQSGATDILVGTQMVTKGLDFQHVSVVGILNAGTMLSQPDFRSHERAFQIMAQVAGRAGRRQVRGHVILQAMDSDEPIIGQVVRHDYVGMYRAQFRERELFNFPPVCRLVYVYLKHRDERVLDALAADTACFMRQVFGERVLGPDTPPIGRIQQMHIRKIILKVELQAPMREARLRLRQLQAHLLAQPAYKSVQFYYDVD